MFSRYVEGSKAVIEKADRSKLQPVALSCMLNIGACKLKMSDWQGAVDSCLEVSLFDVELFERIGLTYQLKSSFIYINMSYCIEPNETR